MNRNQETPAQECLRHQQSIHPAEYVMFCGRCGHATGGGYGHLTTWCTADGRKKTKDHFCCPGSCQLRDGADINRDAPCHPKPRDLARWIAETNAAWEKRRR